MVFRSGWTRTVCDCGPFANLNSLAIKKGVNLLQPLNRIGKEVFCVWLVVMVTNLNFCKVSIGKMLLIRLLCTFLSDHIQLELQYSVYML